jgi:hypothetical protein
MNGRRRQLEPPHAGKADRLKEGAAALAKDGVVDTGDVVAVCRRSSGRATGSRSR